MESEAIKQENRDRLSSELRRLIKAESCRNNVASTSNNCDDDDLKQSECHIDTLELSDLSNIDGMVISVASGPEVMGFEICFQKRTFDRVIVTCQQTPDAEIIWEDSLKSSKTANHFACTIFHQIMITYGKNIRALTIRGEMFGFDWDTIGILERCDSLNVSHEKQAEYLIPKTKLPLEMLSVGMARTATGTMSDKLTTIEKVFSTANVLLPNTIFTSEQFDRLQAAFIHLPVGKIKAQSVTKFINKWQQGEMREDFHKLKLTWVGSEKFDIRRVFNFVGVSIVVPSRVFDVHQYVSPWKTANFKYSISRNDHELLFEVQNPNDS